MKRVFEFRYVQNLFICLYKFEVKILNNLTVSFVCFINRNKSLSKKIVYPGFKIYKKDVSQFFVYCLIPNCIQCRFGFVVYLYNVVFYSLQSEERVQDQVETIRYIVDIQWIYREINQYIYEVAVCSVYRYRMQVDGVYNIVYNLVINEYYNAFVVKI